MNTDSHTRLAQKFLNRLGFHDAADHINVIMSYRAPQHLIRDLETFASTGKHTTPELMWKEIPFHNYTARRQETQNDRP